MMFWGLSYFANINQPLLCHATAASFILTENNISGSVTDFAFWIISTGFYWPIYCSFLSITSIPFFSFRAHCSFVVFHTVPFSYGKNACTYHFLNNVIILFCISWCFIICSAIQMAMGMRLHILSAYKKDFVEEMEQIW